MSHCGLVHHFVIDITRRAIIQHDYQKLKMFVKLGESRSLDNSPILIDSIWMQLRYLRQHNVKNIDRLKPKERAKSKI